VTPAALAPARFRPGPGRAAAVLAVASAVVHLLQVTSTTLGSLAMAGMALACLPCARYLWRTPTASVWRLTAALDAGMLPLHATLVAGEGVHSGHATSGAELRWLGLALIVGQLCMAAAALRRTGAFSSPRAATKTTTAP
jgi:hypothetical protein